MLNLLNLLSISAVWAKVWPILVAILFFGLVITIHEFGHFIFAKLFKVRVNEFAIGMGPAFFKFRKGETLYALRALPIGGYCAMEGEDTESDDDGALTNKKPWKRFIIISAGAFFNLLLGLVFVLMLVNTQKSFSSTIIGGFYENSVSSEYGLQANDKVVKVNGLRVYTSSDFAYALMRGDKTVFDFEVIRNGQNVKITGVQFATEEADGVTKIIYDFFVASVSKTFPNLVKQTFVETYSMMRLVRLSIVDLVSGKYGLKDLSGPVGTIEIIAEAATEAVKGGKGSPGMEMVLNIMAFISINIGLFNLLPIPALDGGRLVFVVLEAIRRKPVLPKYEKYVHAVGIIILLTLIAIVTVKDVVYLFK